MGLWLLAVPLLFWAPKAAGCANVTLLCASVIALSIPVPMMPGMDRQVMVTPQDIQLGWGCPALSRSQRLSIIALAPVAHHYAGWDRALLR